MRRLLILAALLLGSTQAHASTCTYTFLDSAGATQTVNAFCDGSSHIFALVTPTDNAGTTLVGTAGTAAAGVTTIQGIASMTPVGVSAASGGLPPGSIASGAVASGAFASGSIASGAMAAGSQVDLLTMRGTKAAGTAAANSALVGAVYNSTQPTLTDGQQAAVQVSSRGGLMRGSEYPMGAVAETASATGTTSATTATLATASTATTYICGFSIRVNANAAVTGNATVTGTITGTLNYTQWAAPNASGLGVTEQIFTPCIPASANNTTIVVTSAAASTGGVVSVTAWGYLLTP